MKISFYKNSSEQNKVDKTLTLVNEYSDCSAKTPLSIINPTFFINDSQFNLNCNYIYVEDLNRFYFITNMTANNNSIWEIDCHIDVLHTYSQEIKNQYAVIERNTNAVNTYLDDPLFFTYQNPQVVTKEFPNEFDKQFKYVLLTAGGNV